MMKKLRGCMVDIRNTFYLLYIYSVYNQTYTSEKQPYLLLVSTTDITNLLLSCVLKKVSRRGGGVDRFFEKGGGGATKGGDGLQREGLKVVTNCGQPIVLFKISIRYLHLLCILYRVTSTTVQKSES